MNNSLLPQFQEEENKILEDRYGYGSGLMYFDNNERASIKEFLHQSHSRLIDKIVEMIEEEKMPDDSKEPHFPSEGACINCDHNYALNLIQSKLKQ